MKNKLYRLIVTDVEQTLKMKFFIILNVVILISTIAFINFDTVKQVFEKYTGNDSSDIIEVMVEDDTGKFVEIITQNEYENIKIVDYYKEGITDDKVLVEISYNNENIINAKITSNEYIDGLKYSNLQDVINNIRTDLFVEKYDITMDKVNLLNSNVEIERVILNVDTTDFNKYEGVIVAIPFILYMLFIFVASTISSTIGMEKISRTTEYMLTGISETAYLWYNILVVNIVFVIQVILGALYYLFSNIIRNMLSIGFLEATPVNLTNISNLSLDPMLLKIILLTLFQTIICVLILSIIQAIMTSKVNNITDISNSTMLVVTLVIIVCLVCPRLISTTETVNIFIKLISCLPILSVVMLPKLILLHQVNKLFIIGAVVINVISLGVLSIFGSRWFKKGLLDTTKSKKSEKRSKDEIAIVNNTKFKEVIFKISISMLIYLVVSNVLGILVMFINSVYTFSQNIQSIINMAIWILTVIPSYLYLKPVKTKDIIKKNKINLKEIINYVLMALPLVAGVQLIISKLLENYSDVDITDLMDFNFSSGIGITLFLIQIAVLPAIFEELLFRKAMLKRLSKYGNTLSIIITAVCFGLIHQNLTQGVFAFFMGIILAYVTIKTKSIIPAMIIHFFNNFTSGLITIVAKTNNQMLAVVILVLIILVISISLFCLILNIIKNRTIFKLPKTKIKIDNVIKNSLSQYIVLITFILFIAISIYMQMLIF